MRISASIIAACMILCSTYGCVPKSANVQQKVVPPDKSLYETGSDYLNRGLFIQARMTFRTLIDTYPDSDMAAEATFAMADSFYDEGGTENWIQAEAGFFLFESTFGEKYRIEHENDAVARPRSAVCGSGFERDSKFSAVVSAKRFYSCHQ